MSAGRNPVPNRRPMIVGLMGVIGSGKDTVADQLMKLHPSFVRMSFAWCLRKAVETLTKGAILADKTRSAEDKARLVPEGAFGTSLGEAMDRIRKCMGEALGLEIAIGSMKEMDFKLLPANGQQSEIATVSQGVMSKKMAIPRASLVKAVNILTGLSLDEQTEDSATIPVKTSISVGRLLQLLGTEVGRNIFHEEIWTLALEKEWVAGGKKDLLLTDTRFDNEVAFLERMVGHIFYIDADKRLARRREAGEGKDGRSAEHASETTMRHLKGRATSVIENNGSLEDLNKYVTEALWPRLVK